jgi:hypothetical protein
MRGEQAILAFNRGMISRLAMARTDLKRYPLSAQEQTNWVSRVLGSTMLRPGLGYLGGILDDSAAKMLPFVFSAIDTALLELTDEAMRIWVDDELITRPAVTTTITNGNFNTDLASWTDVDGAGSTSVWVAGGYMGLTGDGVNQAKRRQAVAVTSVNIQHALRIVVLRGAVVVSVGTAAGLDDYFSVTLTPGTHSLAFTPTGNFSIDVGSSSTYQALVDSVNIEAAGALSLPTPWTEDDLSMVRVDQSADVVFVACEGLQQRKIERRGPTSWSVVLYEADNGPFRPENTTGTTLTASALTGSVSLVASSALFKAGHVGGTFRIESSGQNVSRSFTADAQESNDILVTGVSASRAVAISITGTFTATISLQRSIGDTGVWEDQGTTYTAPTTTSFNDGLDNQIVAYRLAVKVGNYTSGTADITLSYPSGSIAGVVRITAVTDSLNAAGVVLSALGSTTASENWAEGYWSDYRGWPSAVSLYEGRLWWAGKDKYFGSITDDFANFDPDFEGDAGPIIRSIGSGPVDVINWLLPMQRLMAGTDGSVIAGRSSSFDEPLTPTNFNPKPTLTQGCARVAAIKIDGAGMFVQRGGSRVLSMAYSINDNDYAADDLSSLVPGIGKPGIVSFAAQRQPDTRVHAVRSDGVVALMIYDKLEDVNCWILIETDGYIEDVCVLPSEDEDAVYYVVRRVIGGVDKRFLERWAREDEAIGGTVNKQADSFITYSQSASATISGLDHLIGKDVVVWDNGVCLADADGNIATFTVSGAGTITVTHDGEPRLATVGMAGLQYEARYQSTKLAYLVQPGDSGLTTRKRIHSMGVVLADTHPQGLEYGPDFNTMDSLPLMEAYAVVDPDDIWDEYNYEAFSFPGEWSVDSRMCLRATAPRTCTILAAVAGLNANATS